MLNVKRYFLFVFDMISWLFLNVIRKSIWFMLIDFSDTANTIKQETFHQVKWWYIWKWALCQVPTMTPSSSSEKFRALLIADLVNYLKCCKWKVPSILSSNHQHQQTPSERWGCTRKKGMQIMFSSTPNWTQEQLGTLHQHLALFR